MKKSVIITVHLLFWVILVISVYVTPKIGTYLYADQGPQRLILDYIYFLPIFFYGGYLGIIRFESKKRFLLISLMITLLAYPLLYIISSSAFVFATAPQFSFLLWLLLGCLFGFFVDWYNKKKDIMTLEKENVNSSLALLKFQINPHFLFNTLHNIDALIYENQDKASRSIEKLSNIMRYMLHDTKPEFVELHHEIKHLEDYLSLEKLRLKNPAFMRYSIHGNYQGVKIAPMILIPFVENAFKHSVDSTIENGISIKIEVDNGALSFTCENRFDPLDTNKDRTHGIGLNTVKKRLELIYGSNCHLSIESKESVYKVHLKLDLNEH